MTKDSEEALTGILAIVFVAVMLFVLAPLGAAIGALTALIVTWWFPDMMKLLTTYMRFTHEYQVGAALGYIGAFFRAPRLGK